VALAGGIAFPDRRFLLALGLIGLGASLEIAQAVVPGRFASIGDVAANTLGVALGLTIARFAGPWIRWSA
jgi:VanZ family protein